MTAVQSRRFVLFQDNRNNGYGHTCSIVLDHLKDQNNTDDTGYYSYDAKTNTLTFSIGLSANCKICKSKNIQVPQHQQQFSMYMELNGIKYQPKYIIVKHNRNLLPSYIEKSPWPTPIGKHFSRSHLFPIQSHTKNRKMMVVDWEPVSKKKPSSSSSSSSSTTTSSSTNVTNDHSRYTHMKEALENEMRAYETELDILKNQKHGLEYYISSSSVSLLCPMIVDQKTNIDKQIQDIEKQLPQVRKNLKKIRIKCLLLDMYKNDVEVERLANTFPDNALMNTSELELTLSFSQVQK